MLCQMASLSGSIFLTQRTLFEIELPQKRVIPKVLYFTKLTSHLPINSPEMTRPFLLLLRAPLFVLKCTVLEIIPL